MYKYVAALEYYPNCRSCDSGYFSSLKFFKSIKEALSFALENKNDYELKTIYSCKTGRESFEIQYHLGRHHCTGISFKHKGLNIRTVDNGRGELIWVRE